mgnify:CR=1 FL=1
MRFVLSTVVSFLAALTLAQNQNPPTEDPRVTLIRGLTTQIYTKALVEPKATVQDLFDFFKNRLVTLPEDGIEPSNLKQEREKLFKDLLRSIADLAYIGVTSKEMLGPDLKGKSEIRLGQNEEIEVMPDVVIWLFDIPKYLKTGDPTIKQVKWRFLLVDQNRVNGVSTGAPDWKIAHIISKEFIR